MKKILGILALCLALCGCGQKKSDAVFATFGDWLKTVNTEEGQPIVVSVDDKVYGIANADGTWYQLGGTLTADQQEELENLDVFDDQYEEKKLALLKDIKVDEALDLSDKYLAQSELDKYAGKTVKEVIDAGFENIGWMITEEAGSLFFMKDDMEYAADIEVPADFNPEAEFELEMAYGSKVTGMRFSGPSFGAIPLQ